VAQADEEQIDDLQGVLGWLAMHLAQASSQRRPRMIRHSVTGIELILDQPDGDAAPGWASDYAGTVWTLVEPPDLDEPYDGPMCPTPLLVTIGQPEDDAQLYLDLEADGLLALTGDAEVAADLARSLVTELALSPLADTIRVIAIGDVVDPEAKVLDHLTILDSWDGVTEDLAGWARQSHSTLAEKGWASTFVGRGHEPDHDALVPIAVVADQPPPGELTNALRDALPSAVAVVVVGAFEGAVATIECEPDSLNFDPVDLACSPQAVTTDELADMCRLLVATDSADERQLMDDLQDQYDEIAGANGSSGDPTPSGALEPDALEHGCDEPPDYEVLVRLLGDIAVEGGRPLNPKPTAVVAYLAVHRTVTTERLEEACWFGSDGASHRKRLRDTMTECRSALGSQHFPANRSSAYAAGPMVRTDCELFDWHVGRAASLDSAEAIEHYRAALSLVTGRPFSYPNSARASYGWVDFEHHATTWEYRVASIAQACAELYLDQGEPAEAIAMLRDVIKAIPLNSAVVEALLRAHIAGDDRAGAERVYKEHAAALEQVGLGDPDDSIERLVLDLRGF
jgi:DNA-binding SARP family transcriptional activator